MYWEYRIFLFIPLLQDAGRAGPATLVGKTHQPRVQIKLKLQKSGGYDQSTESNWIDGIKNRRQKITCDRTNQRQRNRTRQHKICWFSLNRQYVWIIDYAHLWRPRHIVFIMSRIRISHDFTILFYMESTVDCCVRNDLLSRRWICCHAINTRSLWAEWARSADVSEMHEAGISRIQDMAFVLEFFSFIMAFVVAHDFVHSYINLFSLGWWKLGIKYEKSFRIR